MRHYMATTGNNIVPEMKYQRIDNLDALKSALARGEYTFHSSQMSDLKRLFQPMLKFLSWSVATAADLANDVSISYVRMLVASDTRNAPELRRYSYRRNQDFSRGAYGIASSQGHTR